MSRYILIDKASGMIWGDSANLDGKPFVGTATEYAKALDVSVGGADYEACEYYESNNSDNPEAVMECYSPPDGFPEIKDGTDKGEIEAVMNGCEHVTTICRRDPEEA